jgi:hypothetical protein
MKLFAVLFLGTIVGTVPALAQTSTSAPNDTPATNEGQSNKSDRSDAQTPATTTPDSNTTGSYRGTGSSGYKPMGANGYDPMGHK